MRGKKLIHISSFFLLLILVAFCKPAFAQQITPDQASAMLAERGIPEDTLRARLLKKGYDPDQIRPEQVGEFQAVILQTIQEIENEQKEAQQANQPTEIKVVIPPAETKKEEEKPPEPVEPPPAPEIEKIPIYGQEIFRNNSISVYQRADELSPPDDYILGSGDEIGIVGFGRSQFDQILQIRSDGFVQPADNLPKILLKGLKFVDAKELLFQRYSQHYLIDRGEFKVSLNKPRNITVNVFGETKTTGAFTLPAFNTAFNVLTAAGGPTDIGSIRKIKVISGSNVRTLDVYAFMNNPGVAMNFFLQNNDFIQVPVADKVVEISGAITRPMAYELLDHENLSQLIKYAGGIKPNAYLSDVKVTRYNEDKLFITNINFRELAASGGDYVLYNGDKVEIKSIEATVSNFVSVSGAVYFPGTFERKPGMKIYDLLVQSKLRPEAKLDFGYLLKFQPDSTYKFERINLKSILDDTTSVENRELSDGDQLQVLELKVYTDKSNFTVSGAVRDPNTFEFDPDGKLKLEDAIMLAGGLMLDADDFGYILRLNPKEPKTAEYIQINIREAYTNPDSPANIEIKPGDQIKVFGRGETRDNLEVSISGAIRKPGKYPYGPGMTVADIVNLAGGLTIGADHERIDIARSEFGNGKQLEISEHTTQLPLDFRTNQVTDNSMELKPFDNIFVRYIPQFEFQQTILLNGEVQYPGMYTIIKDKERISDLIGRAGGLTGNAFPEGAKLYRQGDSTGLVVINLDEILKNNNEPSNVILLSGDVIEIPKSRDLVTIGGYVNLDKAYSEGFLTGEKKISIAFRGEKSAKYYVDNFAAGISEKGSAAKIKVQYADGGVEGTKKFLFLNQFPKVKKGAIVTVGPKYVKPPSTKERSEVDWGTVLRDTVAQATAILTLLILVDQLGK